MDAMTELFDAIEAAIRELKSRNAGKFADQTASPEEATGVNSSHDVIIAPKVEASNNGGVE